ncbi:hypothetical protein RCL1_002442 [Eukaryota sp. TZLM3-RCL]
MYSTLLSQSDAHDDGIWAVKFTSSGHLLTGSVDETVKCWDFQKGLQNSAEFSGNVLQGFGLGVIQLASSTTGDTIAVHSMDSVIRFISDEGQLVKTPIETTPIESWGVSMSPDGYLVASGGHSGFISIWNIESRAKVATLEHRGDFVLSTCFSPDGRFIACGQRNGTVALIDIERNSVVFEVRDHSEPVRALSFSSDGLFLATGSDDTTICLYEAMTGSLIETFIGHSSWVLSVVWDQLSQRIFSSSADSTIRVWDLASRKCLHVIDSHSDQVWSLDVSFDGNYLASVGDDKKLCIYRIS